MYTYSRLLILLIYFCIILSEVMTVPLYSNDDSENEIFGETGDLISVMPIKSIKDLFLSTKSNKMKNDYLFKNSESEDDNPKDIINSQLDKRSISGRMKVKPGDLGSVNGFDNSLSNDLRGFDGLKDSESAEKMKPMLSITGSIEALQRRVAHEIADRQKNRNREFLSNIGKRAFHFADIDSNLDYLQPNDDDGLFLKSQFLYP